MKKFRKDYNRGLLDESKVRKNPYQQFSDWFNEADHEGIEEPNAFCLSTVSKQGKPSSRILLLKAYSKNGFVFFTNYKSKKGLELRLNPNAAILFYWPELERQIRIEGAVKKVAASLSDKYFKSRPPEARASAAVSEQSIILKSREELEREAAKLIDKGNVKRPAQWGGYILTADYFEFWQGRSNRLHDRVSYSLVSGRWKISRLAP